MIGLEWLRRVERPKEDVAARSSYGVKYYYKKKPADLHSPIIPRAPESLAIYGQRQTPHAVRVPSISLKQVAIVRM